MAWRIADELAKHGSVKRGYLGVRTQPVEIPEAAREESQVRTEKRIARLVARRKRIAQKGGLFVGDTMFAVAGHSVSDPDDLFASLKKATLSANPSSLKFCAAARLRMSM
ncbi:MAG: hypothetical protein U0V48_18665 [Anaerolineales bacterium]